MAPTARMRRIAADWEQIQKEFSGHQYIQVSPIGPEPPEKYHVTYFVNGIYMQPNGQIARLNRHEVEIMLHSDYPRYKPLCKILTPIWHPNFRDGQICIGDIWGAGESLCDIIINIGDMIQYKSWNSYSPLSADAAQWAIKNKDMFPVGNADLHKADYTASADRVEIDLFDEPQQPVSAPSTPVSGANTSFYAPVTPAPEPVYPQQSYTQPSYRQPDYYAPQPQYAPPADDNDFEITADELVGIEYVPTAVRMQSSAQPSGNGGKSVNFKTILTKGLVWALIGALLGFVISELAGTNKHYGLAAAIAGYPDVGTYLDYSQKADDAFEVAYKEFVAYCDRNNINVNSESAFTNWYQYHASSSSKRAIDEYSSYDDQASDALYDLYVDCGYSDTKAAAAIASTIRISTGFWSALIATFIGLMMGIGEGVFYGNKEHAVKYALIGAAISLGIGFVGGFLGQWIYRVMLDDEAAMFSSSLVRAIGWALMGAGIGVAVGLIKPEKRRILFCTLGGFLGGLLGGFLFNYVALIIPNDAVSRGVGIILMGALIGLGVGLLEQMAKEAWLKVVRGEFEGKEYLVFNGKTSIGNNSQNTIVLFKDKLVAPHHCDIVTEGNRFVLVDAGSVLGTTVNGVKVDRKVLRQGDAIAIGNSVLVFNTK